MSYRHCPLCGQAPEKARCWPVATGLALRDWLRSRGFDPQAMDNITL